MIVIRNIFLINQLEKLIMNYLTSMTKLRIIYIILIVMFTPLVQADPVDNSGDTDDGNYITGQYTLREAIANAAAGDIITFDSSLAGQTIITNRASNGSNYINVDLTIDGTTNNITINGIGDWMFYVSQDKALTFKNITLDMDSGASNRSNIDMRDSGVLTFDNVTMTNSTPFDLGVMSVTQGTGSPAPIVNINNSTFTNNTPTAMGSAILTMSAGQLTITNSVFDNNASVTSNQAYGGVITLNGSTSAQISNSIFSNNTSNQGFGAAIFARDSSTLTIDSSLFNGNTSNNGGAIAVTDSSYVALHNTTLYNNTSTVSSGNSVGGIGYYGTSTGQISNSTISGNTGHSSVAGGLYVVSGASVELVNSIISDSTSGTDCLNSGTISINTNNLIEDGTCSPTVSGDPLLDLLADNGGDTQTMALQAGSPAINAGDNATCETTDQRGATRAKTIADLCDIGAYEIAIPVAPSGLTATAASQTQINLAWTDNSVIETGFKVEREGTLIITTAIDAISYDNTNLSCGTTYNYSVKSTNTVGDSTAVTASATTQDCPLTAPSDLTSTDVSQNKINLSWTDNSSVETGFKIERDGVLITTTIADTTSYSNGGLTCSTNYSYSVKATNAAEDSSPVSANLSTESCPSIVTVKHKLTVNKVGNGTVTTDFGINCGDICEYDYNDQTEIILIAIPDIDWMFNGWSGDCDENGEVRIHEDKTCTATFISPNIELSVSNISVTEGIADNSYSLWLSMQPIELVTITLSGEGKLLFEPTILIFDSSNWDIPQIVQITDINDDFAEGLHEHTISHTVTSDDPNFNNLKIENVIVQVIDDDSPDVQLSTDNITINEGNIDNNYNIVLTSQPVDNVTINLTTSENTNINPTTLIFSAESWNIPQNITVFVNDDNLAEGKHYHEPIQHQVTSTDLNYNNLTVSNIAVYVIDNDISDVLLSTHNLNLNEGENTSITAVLSVVPTQSVTVNLIPEAGITLSPASLIFDSNNSSQTITVISIDDEIITNEVHAVRISTVSNDSNYNTLTIENLIITVIDNDKPEILLSNDQVTILEEDDDGIAIQDNISIESSSQPIIPLFDEKTGLPISCDLGENIVNGVCDEIIIDDGIAIQDNISIESPSQPIIPLFDEKTGLPVSCDLGENIVNGVCNVGYKIFPEDVNISNTASVAYALFEADVDNEGLISNSTIDTEATLTGGFLTGTIINKGTIEDITFIGVKLSGGTLSGNIINSSQVGGVIQDVYLAAGTVLKGGEIAGTITSDPENPAVITAVTILPGTVLSNVHLSPTVELADGVILGEGITIASEPYTPADFGLYPEDIASLNAESFSKLELEALATFNAEYVESIPANAFSSISTKQMSQIQGLEGLTEEQFSQIPINSFRGLTRYNIGDLSAEIIEIFSPEHIEILYEEEFEEMLSEDISKFLVNTDFENINLIPRLMPNDWQLDMKTGKFTAPFNAKLTARYLPKLVNMPYLINMHKSIGIGGFGRFSLLQSTIKTLAEEDLTDFILSQDENGILNVKGIGPQAGKLYTFIPDADNIIQVNTNEIPIGLKVGVGGFYIITTPEGEQYKVIPAPKDPTALAQVTGSRITIGKSGDVLLEPSNRTRSSEAYEVVIFDPFVEPVVSDLCIEISSGELECDDEDLRRSSRAKTRKIQYPDSTAQTVKPTVLSPDVFIEEALKFEGVERVVYNANGTFSVLYQGKPYYIVPNFTVQNEEVSKNVDPSIVPNSDSSITYNITIEVETDTRSSESYEILTFNPFLEAAPDDLCIEISSSEFECNF